MKTEKAKIVFGWLCAAVGVVLIAPFAPLFAGLWLVKIGWRIVKTTEA